MSAASECTAWLRDCLRDERRPKAEIARAARKAGFTDKTLRMARERLGVRSQRSGFGRGSAAWWSLPDSDGARAPAYVPAAEETDDDGGTYGDPELERALDWLDENLAPPGTSRKTVGVFGAAQDAGVRPSTLNRALGMRGTPGFPRIPGTDADLQRELDRLRERAETRR